MLEAPCAVPPRLRRPVVLGLARLVATGLDGQVRAGVRSAHGHRLAGAALRHPLWNDGLGLETTRRLRSVEAAELLRGAQSAAPLDEGRDAALRALHAGRAGEPPGTIDGFAILRRLGRGGFGTVYLCEGVQHGRVVVKVCTELEDARGRGFRRFLDEAVLISRLQHPGVPRLVALGQHGGHPYIAMEHVEGAVLRDVLEEGALPGRVALGLLSEIARILQAVHAQGLVHRDLKPGNVLVTRGGGACLLDWGLSFCGEVTPGGLASPGGTLPYSAPEQFRHRRGGEESLVDHFALGCLAIDLLARRPLAELVGPAAVPPLEPRPLVDRATLVAEGMTDPVLAAVLDLIQLAPERRAASLEPLLAACRSALAAPGDR